MPGFLLSLGLQSTRRQASFRGTFVGFAGEAPAFPDRVRDQENPADLRRFAWLRSEPHLGISQYFALGRCPAGFPIACALQDIPPPLGSPAPAGLVWLVRSRSAECLPPLPCFAERSTALDGRGVAAARRSVSLGRSPLARPGWGRVRALGLRWTLRHLTVS